MSELELECFNRQQKEFLVSISIHKARNLNVFNADTFVAVTFNGDTKKTKTFQCSDCPFYNEYFVFEARTTLDDLLKKNIRLVVKQAHLLKKENILGEFNVNLSTIWRQPYHMFVKKWGALEKIGDTKDSNAGYLQVDLAIVTENESPAPASLVMNNNDIIDENLLIPSECETSEPANVRYFVNIFHGKLVLKKDYIVRVTFGSTRIQTRSKKSVKLPQWNEQLIFHGKFPSLNELLLFELLTYDQYQWDVKSTCELNFTDMCWCVDGKYNFPAFGPTFLIFNEGVNRNVFYGKVLISIETEEIAENVSKNLYRKQDIIMPLNENDFYNEEVFKINLILMSGEAITTGANHLDVLLNCENNFTNAIEIELKDYEGKDAFKLKHINFNSSQRPLLSLNVKLPDNRLKNQANNLLKMLTREMDSNIANFKLFKARYQDDSELLRKCLNMILCDLKDMLNGLNSKLFHKTFKKLTEWDQNFLKFVLSTLEILSDQVSDIIDEKDVKVAFKKYIQIKEILVAAVCEIQNNPAEIYLHFVKDKKILAFHRFNMLDYFYSQAFDSRGQFCSKMQSVIVKPTTCTHTCDNCGCLFGVFDIVMWIGSDKEVNEFLPENAIEMNSNKINFALEKFYRCQVHVHQAKIQPTIGVFNARVMALINGKCESTKISAQSLSSVFNETLVIENVKIFDIGGETFFQHFPTLVLVFYDGDKKKLEIIGFASLQVRIKPNENETTREPAIAAITQLVKVIDTRKLFTQFVNQFPPPLKWLKFIKNAKLNAEVLLSAELIPLSTASISIQEREMNEPITIPVEISPEIRKFHLEVTFAGIRDAKSASTFSPGRYKIEISIGEVALSSTFSSKAYKKNFNFLDPHVSSYLLLPEQFQYWPAIIVRHLDCSHKKPHLIGAAMLRKPERFFVVTQPKTLQRFLLNDQTEVIEVEKTDEEEKEGEKEPLLGLTKSQSRMSFKRAFSRIPKFLQFHSSSMHIDSIQLDSEYSWWTKFYNSNRNPEFRNETLHELTIYSTELEKQTEFHKLRDWAYPIELQKGKDNEKYATLKCSLKISKCMGKEFFETEKLDSVPSSFRFKHIPNLLCEIPVVLRIYVVEALSLRSRDIFGDSDAYIKIKFGTQVISDRAHYVPNQSNPIFGKRYQVSGVIPRDTTLKISIYDRDSFKKDDLIGKTMIDVEDRMRSKYGASCGLQREYNSSGYNAWRNSQLPSEILTRVCNDFELNLPQFYPTHVQLAGIEFKDTSKVTKDENQKERLALSVLNNFDKIPGLGFKFIPEHVETRSLYRKDRQGVEQGKLLMWLEIFDPKKAVPAGVDITPIRPRLYELRVTIWNAKDVELNEKNIFGSKMSDIYVKGWLDSVDHAQFTDIHYRSLSGEGNFNWRMIFPFKFSIAEDMMITTRKMFDCSREIKMPAVLTLQVWDNDSFTPDDFLGTLSINLSHFSRPALTAEKCSLGKRDALYENLFAIVDRRIRGWFPVRGKSEENGPIKQTGKLEVELQVLTEEKASADPVGKGREGPHPLEPPNRPDTSFNWFNNPLQSMKHIIWPQVKKFSKSICLVLTLILVVIIVILYFIEIPQRILSKMIGI